jgi:hypothetical protein
LCLSVPLSFLYILLSVQIFLSFQGGGSIVLSLIGHLYKCVFKLLDVLTLLHITSSLRKKKNNQRFMASPPFLKLLDYSYFKRRIKDFFIANQAVAIPKLTVFKLKSSN